MPGATKSGNSLTTRYHGVTISIDALTPHFYPTVYLKKVEQRSAAADLNALTFPSVKSGTFDKSFGENPFSQLGANVFSYSFVAAATQEWTYYTVAVYQHTWGLTPQRKSEYQIRIYTNITNKATFDAYDSAQKAKPNVLST